MGLRHCGAAAFVRSACGAVLVDAAILHDHSEIPRRVSECAGFDNAKLAQIASWTTPQRGRRLSVPVPDMLGDLDRIALADRFERAGCFVESKDFAFGNVVDPAV